MKRILYQHRPYWWCINLLGWHVNIMLYPLKAMKRYQQLTQQAISEPDSEKRMQLLVERHRIGNQYSFSTDEPTYPKQPTTQP